MCWPSSSSDLQLNFSILLMKKKRIAKPICLPLGVKRLDLIELPGHIALLALGQPWCRPEHLADLGAHVRLAEELATRKGDENVLKIATRAKRMMQDMTGTPEEIAEFRRLVGATLPWVSMQPNGEIDRAARKFLAAYDKS